MESLIAELQALLGKVKLKWQELTTKEQLLSQREAEINEKMSHISVKHEELAKREADVSHVEKSEAVRIKNQDEAARLNAERESFLNEKRAFEIQKTAKLGDMAREKEALAASWKELNATKAGLEKELNKRVDEFLTKLKK